jgi:hypothetical protein
MMSIIQSTGIRLIKYSFAVLSPRGARRRSSINDTIFQFFSLSGRRLMMLKTHHGVNNLTRNRLIWLWSSQVCEWSQTWRSEQGADSPPTGRKVNNAIIIIITIIGTNRFYVPNQALESYTDYVIGFQFKVTFTHNSKGSDRCDATQLDEWPCEDKGSILAPSATPPEYARG